MGGPQIRRWAILVILVVVFVALVAETGWWQAALHFIFPNEAQVIHPRASLSVLVGEHLKLVLISSVFTVLIGVPLGIWVTRPSGKDFLPIVTDLTSLAQTFPPVAVLALAVPMFGFGLLPTVVALFLYGLLPVVRNTTAGLRAVPEHVLDAAYGMGMSRTQALFRVEIPLAARIVAVADTFDAMTTSRPYRTALAYDVAAGEIVRNAGVQHCATVVAALARLFAAGRFQVGAGEALARALSARIEREHSDW